jgi:hypothetical protein
VSVGNNEVRKGCPTLELLVVEVDGLAGLSGPGRITIERRVSPDMWVAVMVAGRLTYAPALVLMVVV